MCWLFHGEGLQPDGWPTERDENFGLRMVAQAIYVDLVQSDDESHHKVEVWDEKLLDVSGTRFDLRLLGLALEAALEAYDSHASPEARGVARAELLRHLAGRIAARDAGVPDDLLVHLDMRRWAAWVLGVDDLPGWF